MQVDVKSVDPRIKRTRKLLMQAFMELLQEKDFASLSIQDITERATVNRATFYAHFADKYTLMDAFMREQFQQVVASQLPRVPGWEEASLRLLIRATFEFLSGLHKYCKPSEVRFDPRIELVVQQEIAQTLLGWLKQSVQNGQNLPKKVPFEIIASSMSWAIFGSAEEWSHGGQTPSAEEMTKHVFLILTVGVERLVPGLLA